MRIFFSMLTVIFGFIIGLPTLSHATDQPSTAAFKQDSLSINSAGGKTHHFAIELATTKEQQEQGLMHRTKLEEDHGMLFLSEADTYVEMWMKDTLISLDMVFLDSHGKIVYIAANTTPNSTDTISAKRDTRAILELAGGVTQKLGIKIGDQVVYSAFKP